MAININVPLAGQTLNQTRAPINQNFIDINRVFAVNHINYNDPGEGKHKFVTFPLQVAIPGTAATDVNVWYQVDANVVNQLWLKKGVSNPIPWTQSGGAVNAPGWTYLPSGKIFKWGGGVTVAGVATIDTNGGAPGAPNLTNIHTVQLTNAGVTNAIIRLTNIAVPTNHSFQVAASVNVASFYWLAIGS